MRMFENDLQQVRGNDWAARRSGGRRRGHRLRLDGPRTAWLMLDDAAYGSSPGCQRLRTIQMTCRLAIRLRPREAIEDAREQLERVAIEIEPESDPGLQPVARRGSRRDRTGDMTIRALAHRLRCLGTHDDRLSRRSLRRPGRLPAAAARASRGVGRPRLLSTHPKARRHRTCRVRVGCSPCHEPPHTGACRVTREVTRQATSGLSGDRK